MEIHALGTGTVRLKEAFLHARSGPSRRPRLLLPGPFSGPMPIHAWLVEHDGLRILVDAGETADVRDLPFARFDVRPEDELPVQLERLGLRASDLDLVVVTHLHADHVDGLVHVGRPALVHDAEWRYARGPVSRTFQRLLRQPLPEGVAFEPIALDGGPFGAFAASRALTGDGRVVAVATPGHTPGHLSVVCVDDDGRHVLLAGDVADSLEQLLARRHDAIAPKPAVHVATLDRVLAHAREHPTVFLPSHDPDAADRLARRTVLSAVPG